MQRELKFRAWDSTRAIILPGQSLKSFALDSNIHDKELAYKQWDELIIEQYTGLKDKNGKEIYEGDIVRFYPDGDKDAGEEIGQVRYSERRAAFMFRVSEMTSVMVALNIPSSITITDPESNCEVIGNIHENPELLK